jgi:hypothetical protein
MTMNDFSNLTPPADRSLTSAQRARVLGRLSVDAEDGRTRPWVLSAAAAAAVLAVIGGGLALSGSLAGSNDGSPGAGRVVQPASGAGATVPSSSPTPNACDVFKIAGGASGTIPQHEETVKLDLRGALECLSDRVPPTCQEAVREQLPAAKVVATSGDITFWQSGQRWVQCFSGVHSTTVNRVGTLGESVEPAERFAFSSDHAYPTRGRAPSTFVAGGPVGADDSRISYTFPDGHRQQATYVDSADGSRWWVLQYAATRGVLADPQTNWGTLAPVVVRVGGAGGDRYELDWSASGCAQINHGC